ncbi:hypothetical protein OIU77_030274 [Salix suchowensis]|uniref:Uncharacterized protein n=1 Tax=Salix suchowensis TaxID=1278906 RepID=A0ABQ9BBI3_9ROSI|nr:hypothetical protein OIU77_030274 [Salix suchowensis]
MQSNLKTRLAEFPMVVAVYTCYICCHRFICTPGLHLIVSAFALSTTTTLKLISCGFCLTTTLTIKQHFLFNLVILSLPLFTCHFFRAHGNKPLWLDLSKKNFSPQIWVVLVLDIEHNRSVLQFLCSV